MAAFQQFKLPPILPDLLTLYSYDRVFAGGLMMSIYAVIGLLASLGLAAAMMRFGPPRASSPARWCSYSSVICSAWRRRCRRRQ